MRHTSPPHRPCFDGYINGRGEILDTQSSSSRQHYIETGRYLTPAEVTEQQARDDSRAGRARDTWLG
jgi:hypothetical protein